MCWIDGNKNACEACTGLLKQECRTDDVANPKHYQGAGGMRVIDVIRAFDLGYETGNIVKYVLRCGKKGSKADAIKDLRKAIQYASFAVERLEKESGNAK